MKKMMTKYTALLLMALYFFAGCSSLEEKALDNAEDALKAKNYAVAVEKSAEAIVTNPEFADAYPFFKGVYDKAVAYYKKEISVAESSGQPLSAVKVYESYISLQKITTAVKTLTLPLVNPNPEDAWSFTPVTEDYSSLVTSNKEKAADAYYAEASRLASDPTWEISSKSIAMLSKLKALWGQEYKGHYQIGAKVHYEHGLQLERKGTKADYRAAIASFGMTSKWVKNYKDSQERIEMNKLKAYTTFYVVDDRNVLKGSQAKVASSIHKSIKNSSAFKNFNNTRSRASYSTKLKEEYPGVLGTLKNEGYTPGNYRSAVAGAEKIGLNYIVFIRNAGIRNYRVGKAAHTYKPLTSKDSYFLLNKRIALDKQGKPLKLGTAERVLYNTLAKKDANGKPMMNRVVLKKGKSDQIVVDNYGRVTHKSVVYKRSSSAKMYVNAVLYDVANQKVIANFKADFSQTNEVSWQRSYGSQFSSMYRALNKVFKVKNQAPKKPANRSKLYELGVNTATSQISTQAANVLNSKAM